jgi:putative heme-binding domain-containing protein
MNISRYVGVVISGFLVAMSPARGADLPVQMIVPGFVVRELPIDLTNITSLEYTADGKLWALGYDGRVHVLTDSDGDGIEDAARTWWQPKDAKAFRGPIGMKVTRDGVYVASKGKISLLKDTDNDGTADTEEIIATGWKEAYVAVDATGLALDKDGNVYFGLGCADFSNAYQLDKEKKPHYDINSTQGTIQKLSADHKTRETLATGVRFAIGIAFNRFGDLFWTDQEGDTWTHGNHLDELNVLLPGKRHYGFPERHPEYLPNTDDEGPVVGFGPQHQSTCGLKFNEPRAGWKTFGPKLWENDALVVGESRGKLWRVPLAKVREGYVGRQVLIGVTQMLTIDLAVSPKGEMVICCHSGPPDWGTGPTGKGRLFKISYVDEKAPQPVIAWPAAKDEIRVAFDRAIDKSVEKRLDGLSVACGEFVRAADRLEGMRPPYAVVKAQMQSGHRELKIASAKLSEDARTLSVRLAEPMPWQGWYALAIPGVKAPGASGLGTMVDVDFPLAGVELSWDSRDDRRTSWEGWAPHFDLNAAKAIENDDGTVADLTRTAQGRLGVLTMHAALNLPGSGAVTLSVHADRPFITQVGDRSLAADKPVDGKPADYRATIDVPRDGKSLPVLTIGFFAGKGLPMLDVTYHGEGIPTERPVALQALRPRWAPAERQPVVTTPAESPLVNGGDWTSGRALFFGDAKCSTCHTVKGEGGNLGPNLSNLVHVNPESVLQDIVEPSARINPDHVSYVIQTKSGDTISGLVRQEADKVLVYESLDKVTTLARDDVQELRPSRISLMPEGYKDLGEQKLRDLLTFLTVEPPKGK